MISISFSYAVDSARAPRHSCVFFLLAARKGSAILPLSRCFESSWPLRVSTPPSLTPPSVDAQASKLLCPGTEASCGGRGTGWWRWRCGGCLLPSGRPCWPWLRLPWSGALMCCCNCSDLAVGTETHTQTRAALRTDKSELSEDFSVSFWCQTGCCLSHFSVPSFTCEHKLVES